MRALLALLFRFSMTAVAAAVALGCVYLTGFAFSCLWIACTHQTHLSDLPSWTPLFCIPAGVLLFLGIVRATGFLKWYERTLTMLEDYNHHC